MIQPKKHFANFERPVQLYETRIDQLRLDYNELVPHLNEEVFRDILSKLHPDHLTAYPEMQTAYQTLAEKLQVSEDQLILAAGSDSAIRQVLETFCYENDEMIISYPTYGMYLGYSEIMNLKCIKIPIQPGNFSIDADAFIENITERTKIIAIANPNGNVGSIIPEEDLEKIIVRAAEHDVVVLLDQAYAEYYEDHYGGRIEDFDNLVIVRTFSKAWGIAGLRYGYILTNKRLRNFIYKAKPVVEINSMAAFVGSYLLENDESVYRLVEETKEGKEYLAQEMEAMGFKVYRGYANFIQVHFNEEKDSLIRELQKRNIYIKDNGDTGLLAGSARITVGPKRYMALLVEAIQEIRAHAEVKQ